MGDYTGMKLPRKQRALSDEMMTRWTNFAYTGNPNGITYRGWTPVEDDTSRSLTNSTTRPSFIFSSNGGVMRDVPDKVEQCSVMRDALSTGYTLIEKQSARKDYKRHSLLHYFHTPKIWFFFINKYRLVIPT